MHKKYKDTVVFSDGYGETLSTKHHKHAMRTKGKTVSADLNIAPNMLICDRDMFFLVYENNKKFLVELLSMKMTQNKIVVYHAKEDADTLIVLTTISIVDKDGIPVIVVAQDTDILVFLCYYHPQDCVNLFLQAGCDNIFDISSIQIADREDILILK